MEISPCPKPSPTFTKFCRQNAKCKFHPDPVRDLCVRCAKLRNSASFVSHRSQHYASTHKKSILKQRSAIFFTYVSSCKRFDPKFKFLTVLANHVAQLAQLCVGRIRGRSIIPKHLLICTQQMCPSNRTYTKPS